MKGLTHPHWASTSNPFQSWKEKKNLVKDWIFLTVYVTLAGPPVWQACVSKVRGALCLRILRFLGEVEAFSFFPPPLLLKRPQGMTNAAAPIDLTTMWLHWFAPYRLSRDAPLTADARRKAVLPSLTPPAFARMRPTSTASSLIQSCSSKMGLVPIASYVPLKKWSVGQIFNDQI